MGQIIDVPSQGLVEFPDGMSDADIVAAIKKTSMQAAPKVVERAGPLTGLARGVASALDNTVGAAIPFAAGYLSRPALRLAGNSDAEATASADKLAGYFDKPFGKAFRVADTPEYQNEAAGRLTRFVGEKVGAGSDWVAEKTGLPPGDVGHMAATASLAAPVVASKAFAAAKPTLTSMAQQAAEGVKAPFESRLQARRQKTSMEDYAKGPQIDAAAEMQRLKIAAIPTDIQNTKGVRLMTAAAGDKGPAAIVNFNRDRIREITLNELDLPPTTQLNGPKAFNDARSMVAGPYDEVKSLPTMTADAALIKRLDSLRPDPSVIGPKEFAASINNIVDDAIAKAGAGLNGEQLLKNVRVLRERSKKTYNNRSATIEALDIADTNLAIANALESMVESNIAEPKLLGRWKDARQKMARAYAYEGATDFNTGMPDVKKISRITAKDNQLTGDIASIGQIAGNFPDVFTPKATSGWPLGEAIGRSGIGGSLGGVTGFMLGGYPGAVAGSLLGATGGLFAKDMAAARIASPGYQAGLKLRDARIPEKAALPPPPPSTSNLPVPFMSEGDAIPNLGSTPDWVPGKQGVDPAPRFGVDPQPSGLLALSAPSSEATMARVNAARGVDYGLDAARAQATERAAAATEAAQKGATGRGTLFDLDPITGKLKEVSQGLKGATPDVMQSTAYPLDSAAQKISAGQSFALTLEELNAWKRTKVDLAAASPEFRALSDKAATAKMLDRKWVESTIAKAKEKAAGFAEIEARAKSTEAARKAAIEREKLMSLVEEMQTGLLPRQTKQQGPKTRAAQRGLLDTQE